MLKYQQEKHKKVLIIKNMYSDEINKKANPLYPVPKLMTKKELEAFYELIADRSDKK